jgi:hypothetical protein
MLEKKIPYYLEQQREKYRELLPTIDIIDLQIPENLDDWDLIESFGPNEPGAKFAIIHRFGLFNEKRKTLHEAALMVGICKERIRCMEARGLRFLRATRRQYLYPFIRNEKLFEKVTGYRNIREWMLYNHIDYEQYLKEYK